MPEERSPRIVEEGIQSGIVAAAATAGALVSFGHAHGTTFRPINSIAHVLLGSRAFLFDRFDLGVTLLGLLVHVVAVVLWGIVFAGLTARLRGRALAVAAVALAGVAVAVDFLILPGRFRPGFEIAISRPEVAIVYLVMAFALAGGLKLSRAAADDTE